MDNNELMRIMLILNKSKKNKDAAIFFGAIALLAVGVGCYCYIGYKKSKDEQSSQDRRHKSLLSDYYKNLNIIQKQQEQIDKQTQQINDFVAKNGTSKIEEKKG